MKFAYTVVTKRKFPQFSAGFRVETYFCFLTVYYPYIIFTMQPWDWINSVLLLHKLCVRICMILYITNYYFIPPIIKRWYSHHTGVLSNRLDDTRVFCSNLNIIQLFDTQMLHNTLVSSGRLDNTWVWLEYHLLIFGGMK